MNGNTLYEVVKWLENEIRTLNNEIATRNQTIRTLQNLVNGLKSYEEDSDLKEKYDELSKLYEKEKERLIKLHNHYTKKERELQGWEDWFSANKEIFSKLFSVGPEIGKNAPFKPPSEPIKKKKKIKKRSKKL